MEPTDNQPTAPVCPDDATKCAGYFDDRVGGYGLTHTGNVPVEWLRQCPLDAAAECPHAERRYAIQKERCLRAIGFGRRVFGATWDKVPASIKERLTAYCETLHECLAAGEGRVISGATGNGKTHCLALIALAAGNAEVRYATCTDLFDLLHRERQRADDLYRNCDLLLLDDLGTQYNSDWGLTGFLALMDYRYREMRATCIATNLSAKDAKNALGQANAGNMERVLDRLREMSKWWVITEASQRQAMPREVANVG